MLIPGHLEILMIQASKGIAMISVLSLSLV